MNYSGRKTGSPGEIEGRGRKVTIAAAPPINVQPPSISASSILFLDVSASFFGFCFALRADFAFVRRVARSFYLRWHFNRRGRIKSRQEGAIFNKYLLPFANASANRQKPTAAFLTTRNRTSRRARLQLAPRSLLRGARQCAEPWQGQCPFPENRSSCANAGRA